MNKRQLYNIVLLVILILFVIIFLYFANDYVGKVKGVSEQQDDVAKIIFLDVGQGDAILIQEGWTQILIDGGNGQDIMNRLGEFMPMGDRKIEFMVATHPDEDHMGGLIKVLSLYEVGEILESGIDCDKDLCEKWEELIAADNIPVVDAKLGQEINFGEDVDITVLYPFMEIAGEEFKNTNDASLVLKAVVEDRSYLLTGDTESKAEKELVASNLDLSADVLKVSHHGSKNATSAEFLLAVSPKQAVISVGENSYGHPTEEVLTRLRNMNIEIFRTDEVGSVRF
ncbi:MAG: ComEC/Rec2 family competence protein [Candidatus Pacebacteria bacterium]|nr:ComEC/Rec2 family competence protein [Candidatus Paceibacterota bacterium]